MQQRFILLLSVLLYVAADAQQIPFTSYTPKDGLVNNRVKKVMQDSKGQLYFLTFGGLSIHDGTGFTNFTRAEGLASDIVNDAVEMGADSVWIATNAPQLNYYSKGKIKKFATSDGFCPVINAFHKNDQGIVYAACDEGLFLFSDNRFIKQPLYPNEAETHQVFLTSLFRAGNFLLINTDQLLGQYKGKLLLYDIRAKTTVQTIKDAACTSITLIDGNIWLTSPKGISVAGRNLLEQGKIILSPLPEKFAALKNQLVTGLFFDSHKNLWASLTNNGLLKIDPAGKTKKYAADNGLLSNSVSGIFEDRESALWFINEYYGLQKLVSNNTELIARPWGAYVQSMTANKAGDSLYYWDYVKNTLLLQTAAGIKKTVVINTKNKVGNISVSGSNIYLNDADHVYHLPVSALGKGVVAPQLIYTYDNGYKFNRSIVDARGVVILQGDAHLIAIINPATISRIGIKYYTDEGATDSKGRIWYASRANELYVLETDAANPDHYLRLLKDFSDEIKILSPRSITVDRQDHIWVGTRENGLYCYRVNDQLDIELVKHLTKKEGLTENFITLLYCDKKGAVWAGTSSGIDKITWNKNDCIIDNVSRRSNLFPFISFIAEDDRQNIIALTNDGNMVKIAAEENKPSTYNPQLFIKYIKAGEDTLLYSNTTPTFSYKQNTISVYVASPSFYDESQIRYSYILNGGKISNWSSPTTNAQFDFINLSPGSYTLKIKVIYPAARYPEQTISCSFTIKPPWWQTWWFKIATVLVTIGLLIFLLRRYYSRKLEKQKQVLEKKDAIEKERSRIASDIHDDLGAGLSTLRFLSEKVKRNSFSETTKNDAEKIVNNSNELVQKMNELIWAMNEKNDTLEDLLFYTRSYAAEYGEEHNLQMDISIPEHIPGLMVTGETRRNVFLTIKESLHNVVKHAAAKKITIRVQINKFLHITIKDDGQGFGTANNNGNGLKNMKKRMTAVGGTLEIINASGVSVTLSVPLN